MIYLKKHRSLSRRSYELQNLICMDDSNYTKNALTTLDLGGFFTKCKKINNEYEELLDNIENKIPSRGTENEKAQLELEKTGTGNDRLYVPDIYYDWAEHLNVTSHFLAYCFEITTDRKTLDDAVFYSESAIKKMERALALYDQKRATVSNQTSRSKKTKRDRSIDGGPRNAPEDDYEQTVKELENFQEWSLTLNALVPAQGVVVSEDHEQAHNEENEKNTEVAMFLDAVRLLNNSSITDEGSQALSQLSESINRCLAILKKPEPSNGFLTKVNDLLNNALLDLMPLQAHSNVLIGLRSNQLTDGTDFTENEQPTPMSQAYSTSSFFLAVEPNREDAPQEDTVSMTTTPCC